jgi:hypothetical protein
MPTLQRSYLYVGPIVSILLTGSFVRHIKLRHNIKRVTHGRSITPVKNVIQIGDWDSSNWPDNKGSMQLFFRAINIPRFGMGGINGKWGWGWSTQGGAEGYPLLLFIVFCRTRLRKGESKQISSQLLKPHAHVFPCSLVKPKPTWIRVHNTAWSATL